jgi:hypothetical protein
MKRLWPILAFTAFLAAASTVSVAAPVAPGQAAQHVGEQSAVSGVVRQVSISRKGTIFINFGGTFPNEVFYAVIFRDDAWQFGDVQELEGRSVTIQGVISMYRGKPQIIVTRPSQIVR